MKYLIYTLASLLIIASACKKPEDIECDEATICVRNTSEDQFVIYGWNTNLTPDTLFPGECAIQTVEDVRVEYDRAGNVVSSSTSAVTFQTGGAGYVYLIDQCYIEVEAPGGYWDPRQDCDNGKFDPSSGELDTDCGGYCDDCPDPSLSCTPEPNYIDWEGLFAADASLSHSDYAQFFTYSHDAKFTLSNGFELEATFRVSKMPSGTRRFEIGNLDHEMTLKYNEGWGFWYADEGQDVYLYKDPDGSYRMVFCDLSFTKDNTTVTASADLALEH